MICRLNDIRALSTQVLHGHRGPDKRRSDSERGAAGVTGTDRRRACRAPAPHKVNVGPRPLSAARSALEQDEAGDVEPARQPAAERESHVLGNGV